MIDKTPYRDRTELIKAEIKGSTGLMYRYAVFLCRDKRLAEDLTQDAWVNIFNSLAIQEKSSQDSESGDTLAIADEPILDFRAYARRCVYNAYVDYLRNPPSRTGSHEVTLPDDDDHRVFGIDDKVHETVSSLDLRNALLQLSEEDRVLVYLKYYEGYGIAEAALEATGLIGGDAYRRHTGVLRKLRALLKTEEARD